MIGKLFKNNNNENTNDQKPFENYLLVFAVLVGLGALIVVAIYKPIFEESQETCIAAHEDYGNLLIFSDLKNYKKFAVASDNKDCSTVGKKFFEKNGSAIDVAIATALCNSVMNAQSMGIGGGHFLVFYKKDTNVSYVIDAREKAPLNSNRSMFLKDPKKSLTGGLASAIPGEIKGYWAAHQLAGKLPWKDLFQPTIDMCKNGFKISNALSKAIKDKESLIKNNSVLNDIFINPETKSVYKENDTIKMIKLANTLTVISEQGPDAFYNGSLTKHIVDEINENSGNVTLKDFLNYNVKIYENRLVLKLDNNYRIYTAPPPSSGILISFIMKIMKGYNLTSEKLMSQNDKKKLYHRLTEAFKHAYAQRSFIGDEEFVDINKLLYDLNDDLFIRNIRDKIKDDMTFPMSYYGSVFEKTDAGTAHISVLASNGDAVGITSTINNYLGAKYAGRYTGIIYNDCMDDFSTSGVSNSFYFAPSEANFIEPGKRALSSMSPIIIVDDNNNVRLILGASGGSKIISSIAQVAIKSLWMNVDLKSAIDSRRIHHQLHPEYIGLEAGFSEEVQKELKNIGHETKCFNFGGSTVQGIKVLDDFQIHAYSDPRKGGQPDGV